MEFFKESFFSLSYLKSSGSFLVMVGFLWFVLMVIGVFVGQKWRFEWSKLSAFECGFDSLSSTRNPFSLRFFLLALLFLVFDVEIILLLPYIFSVKILWLKMNLMSSVFYFLLLLILFLGLVHELNEGTLDWSVD